ncbi:membrane protein insertion efficiency factor YidD [bacterium]|nr:membrane protein insertion efficiency factor YidD [bacterium]
MIKLVVFLIRFYQKYISAWLGTRCRFYPSCSQYMLEAVDRFGVIVGVAKGLRRLSHCHPFHEGGYDPVGE